MIVCSSFRVSWFHLRAFSWLPAVMMQNVTSFIQKVALHSRIHDRNFRFLQESTCYALAGNTSKFADFDTFDTLKFADFDAFNTLKFADFDIFPKKSLKIKELLVSLQQYKR